MFAQRDWSRVSRWAVPFSWLEGFVGSPLRLLLLSFQDGCEGTGEFIRLYIVCVNIRSPLAQMEEERREHVSKMKKMEMEMEQVFEMKVKEKIQKLKDSEAEVLDLHPLNVCFYLNCLCFKLRLGALVSYFLLDCTTTNNVVFA